MKRKAKKDYSASDLHRLIFKDNESFDEHPRCACPATFLPPSITTIFCITKCKRPCLNFRNFTFITDLCGADICSNEHPCPECLKKMEDFKPVMMKTKAMWSIRSGRKKSEQRAKISCRINDKKMAHLAKIKERKDKM